MKPTVLTAEIDLKSGAIAERFDGATHAFANSGARTLEMTSIHPAAEMATEWIVAA